MERLILVEMLSGLGQIGKPDEVAGFLLWQLCVQSRGALDELFFCEESVSVTIDRTTCGHELKTQVIWSYIFRIQLTLSSKFM